MLVVAFLAPFVAFLPSVFASTSRAALFSAFQTTYDKSVTPNDQEAKFQAFSASLDRTASLNQDNQNAGGSSSVFGVTPFSDLTPEQFQSMYLTYKPPAAQVSPSGPAPRDASLTTTTLDSLDWRNINGANYISPVRSQGQCGACWVFAALAAVESWQMMAGLYTQQLSAQQVTSCEVGAQSTGCEGGATEDAFNYIMTYGVTSDAVYPYVSGNDGVTRNCKFASWAPPTSPSSSRRLLGISTPTTKAPTAHPSTKAPTAKPTTKRPTSKPTTKTPTQKPTKPPTIAPTTKSPIPKPTTKSPIPKPTTKSPTAKPTTKSPTAKPTTQGNTLNAPPTAHPTTKAPTAHPATKSPTAKPSPKPPTIRPTTGKPTTRAPTASPTTHAPIPTKGPTKAPTRQGYPRVGSVTSWEYVNRDEASLLQALQPPPSNPKGGPISVCLAASSFQDYVGGIMKVCTGPVNHCVQVVGYGTENGTAYWTLKNQWGSSWGEGGFLRILRGVNLCNVASNSMIYPVGVTGTT